MASYRRASRLNRIYLILGITCSLPVKIGRLLVRSTNLYTYYCSDISRVSTVFSLTGLVRNWELIPFFSECNRKGPQKLYKELKWVSTYGRNKEYE